MARRIIIDGIKVEGDEASRIVAEVLHDVDETGTSRRVAPLGLLAGTAVLVGVVCGITGWVLVHIAGLRGKWMTVISVAVALTVTFAWSHVHLRLQRRLLRQAMRRRGFELCPRCGYWLKGLGPETRQCPECGAERTKSAAGVM